MITQPSKLEGNETIKVHRVDVLYRVTSLARSSPHPPRSPLGPKHRPTVGSRGGAVSYERCTPVGSEGGECPGPRERRRCAIQLLRASGRELLCIQRKRESATAQRTDSIPGESLFVLPLYCCTALQRLLTADFARALAPSNSHPLHVFAPVTSCPVDPHAP